MYTEERAITPTAVSTYWANMPTDDPFSINGFAGTFAFSDHSRIPEPHVEFVNSLAKLAEAILKQFRWKILTK
jgi:hypothetical protein